jgi:hypothetical protein
VIGSAEAIRLTCKKAISDARILSADNETGNDDSATGHVGGGEHWWNSVPNVAGGGNDSMTKSLKIY